MTFAQPENTHWSVIAVAVGAGLLAAFQIGKMPAAILGIRSEFTLSLVTAGWIMSAIAATTATLGVCGGILSDRIGHRRLLLASLILLALGNIWGGLIGDILQLLLSRW